MCGITGILSKTKNSNLLAKVSQSNQKQFLRGPDSGNVFINEYIALGHRRLSIIDTTNAASQPMKDASERYVIVFNGEIFNFKELSDIYLKDILIELNKTEMTSDTEVLLYLLIKFGTACLEWLGGFFAFAFYDILTEELIIARDRFGKKPFLYYSNEDFFAFASEMKGLLAYDIPKEIDFTALYQYLQFNNIPQPQSMLKGIQKLKPGHFIIIKKAKIEYYKSYYKLETSPQKYNQYSYNEAQKELIRLMDHSVQERMISDVPLGAFLSGGIDSSVVVALASQHTDKLKTFSIGFKNNPYFDETYYANLVAKKYKTDHTVFSLSSDDFLEHIFKVLDYLDEPFADSSAIPQYILSMYTRQKVTVALSGDGADEVFAGYRKHRAEWQIRQDSWKNNIVKLGLPLWKILPKSRNNKITDTFRKLQRFAEGAQLDAPKRYLKWLSLASASQVKNLFKTEIKNQINQDKFEEHLKEFVKPIKTNDFNEILLTDINMSLLNDMLVKVDLMSMANSLEVRSPFLDYKVVDFAFGLPAEYKINKVIKKRIVQDAFRKLLPEELYDRPKKGFEIPLLDWFRNELWITINDDLLGKTLIEEQGIFEINEIETLKNKLKSNNPEDSHATIWALIVFQYWWKKYFKSNNFGDK